MSIITTPELIGRWRGDDSISHHDIGPRARAPRLALVADLRGQELNGMFVLSRLAAFLRDIEAGRRRDLQLRERVLVIPSIGNAVETRGMRIQQAAWSRWAMTEVVAAVTQAAYYRVAIHPSPDVEEMPQVRLYAPNDDERASACLFGLPAVIERPFEPDDVPTLVRTWRLCGGENFALQAGQANGLQTAHCESLFHALVAFLDRTGIVSGLRLADEEEELGYFNLHQVFVVLAEQSGIFSSHQEVGRWVQAGEELGQVYDGLTGGERVRMVAPVAGLLASLRRQPLLREGDLVARILTPARTVRRERPRLWGERHGRRAGFRS